MDEYLEVLNRDKFSKYYGFKNSSKILIYAMQGISMHRNPSKKLNISRDKNDNKFLELALEIDANYIVTGNTKDFPFRSFQKTTIVTPAEFWKYYL